MSSTAALPTDPNPSDRYSAFLVGFAGWTLDAFDFFLVVFCLTDIGREFQMTDVAVAFGITVTLILRPVGALVFGLFATNADYKNNYKAPAEARLQVLTALGTALRKAGQPDQAKEVENRVDKMEMQAYDTYTAEAAGALKVAKFAGRKNKSNRNVLVELFDQAPQTVPSLARTHSVSAPEPL